MDSVFLWRANCKLQELHHKRRRPPEPCAAPSTALSVDPAQFHITNLDSGESTDLRYECCSHTTFSPSANFLAYRQLRVEATKALWAAVEKNDAERVRELVCADASVHSKGLHGWTALHMAAARGYLAVAQVLLAYEASVFDLTESGHTPLHLAVISGTSAVATLLLQHNAPVNTQDHTGCTALHYAAQLSRGECVRVLLSYKADGEVKNYAGETPADLAADTFVRNLLPTGSVYARHPLCGVMLRSARRDVISKLLRTTSAPPQTDPYTFQKERQRLYRSRKIAEYQIIAVLGVGSFAHVYLAKHLPTHRFVALKVIEKSAVEHSELARYVLTEKNILRRVRHPCIVRMYCSFQTVSHLILVLEYCSGGTLADLLKERGRLKEEYARIITCELILALDELHQRCILYRDLKPANVLLTAEGHAVLSDFGLAKQSIHHRVLAQTLCGTPAYLSPEMIKGAGHGFEVDWYALGVLLYHMLVGNPPFLALTQEQLFSKISSEVLRLPWSLSRAAKDLISKLLCRDPGQRLGGSGAAEIQRHPFFRKVDWTAVATRRAPVLKPDPEPLVEVSGSVDLDDAESEAQDLELWSCSSN